MVFKNSMFLLSMSACFLSYLAWSHEASEKSQNDSFTLISFNVRRDGPEKKALNKWLVRKAPMGRILKEFTTRPSIICFQEPTLSQVHDIASFLPAPQYQWFGQARGKQWLGIAANEYLPIFFDTTRFNFITGGSFVLNKGSGNPFKWKKNGRIKRIAVWANLFDTQTQQSFFVYNLHLDHQYDAVRESSIHIVMEHIKSHVFFDDTVFVLGDFNTMIDGSIKELFESNGFIHAKAQAHSISGPVNTAIDWNGKEKSCIDHILIRPAKNRIDIVNYTTFKTTEFFDVLPSDHYPVMTTVSMR